MSPVYLRSNVTRFVTLFVERSGSTFLATALDTHPAIQSKREEFSALRQNGSDGAGQVAWLREYFTPQWMGQYKAIGFKTKMVDILDLEAFEKALMEFKCKVIQLQRRNIVKAAISTMNAARQYQKTGNWNLLSENDRLPPFQVDLAEFDRLLKERLEWDRELEEFAGRLPLPKLQLYYEDMLADQHDFMLKVFRFLEVKPQPVQGKTLKNTSDNLREVITNFDELRLHYRGTQFESMFDEVVTQGS